MANFILKNSNFVIDENLTIQDALEIITINHKGAVLVVNQKGILQGVVSDGDIRRAFLRQATNLTPINKIMNPNVISILDNESNNDSLLNDLFESNTTINLIPIIDKDNKIKDIRIRL